MASVDFFKSSEAISDANALLSLQLLLEGQAHTWWVGIKTLIIIWEDTKKFIREEYAPRPPAYQVYLDIFGEKQDRNTPTSTFIVKKRALFSLLENPHHEETQVKMVFGLLRLEIREKITFSSTDSFSNLLTAARGVEATLREKENETTYQQETEKKKPHEKCTFCKNPGHDVSVCRKKIRAEQENGQTKATKNELRCYGCGQPGVIKRNCTKCSSPQPSNPTMAFNAINVEILERPAVDIEIYGFPGTAFLDSGDRTSLASPRLQDIFVKMNPPLQERTARVVFATGNSEVQTVRTVTVPVKLKGRTFQTPFVCGQGGADAVTLLGADFARIAGLVIDFHNDSYHFHGHCREVYKFIKKETGSPLPLAQVEVRTENIDEDEEFDAIMQSDGWSKLTNNYGPEVSPLPPSPPRVQPATIHVPARPSNGNQLSRSQFQLDNAKYAIKLEYMEVNYPEPELFPRMDFSTLDIQFENEGRALTSLQKNRLNNMLNSNADLFENHGPPSPHATHHIVTDHHCPISSPPYRMSPQRNAILREEVENLLENDIVEACESAWAVPVVLVPKPDGKTRLCVDYRKLNAITKPDVCMISYPLPRIENLLHSTGNATFISTMDLKEDTIKSKSHLKIATKRPLSPPSVYIASKGSRLDSEMHLPPSCA
jgi:hypothetical protein